MLGAILVGFAGLFVALRPAITTGVQRCLLAMVVGATLMVTGNGAEYWIAYAMPHVVQRRGRTCVPRAIIEPPVVGGG